MELEARSAAVRRDEEADVCIVGAGYTGLWTAVYPADRPHLWRGLGKEPAEVWVVLTAAHGGSTAG